MVGNPKIIELINPPKMIGHQLHGHPLSQLCTSINHQSLWSFRKTNTSHAPFHSAFFECFTTGILGQILRKMWSTWFEICHPYLLTMALEWPGIPKIALIGSLGRHFFSSQISKKTARHRSNHANILCFFTVKRFTSPPAGRIPGDHHPFAIRTPDSLQ